MNVLHLTCWLILAGLAFGASAEPVVVVSAASAIGPLSQDQVINIFLGRYRKLPNGDLAVPIDQPETGSLRSEFYRGLVNKDLNEINAYWARLIFSGRTSPPIQAVDAAEVIQLLKANPGGMTYVERNQVDKRLRIVLEFPK
jgi:hypothetical protein